MRIRSKIAYQAFQNRCSINELIVKQIASSYEQLTYSGSIPLIAGYTDQCIDQFDQILDGDVVSSTITKLMALNLDPVIRKRKEFLYIKKEMKGLKISDADELEPKQREKLLAQLTPRDDSGSTRSRDFSNSRGSPTVDRGSPTADGSTAGSNSPALSVLKHTAQTAKVLQLRIAI